MNEKEIAEIRRHFSPEKTGITHIRGCYVNEKQEIISQFNQSLPLMQEAEAEKFLSILKKTLSGTLEKNLFNMEFSTRQVVDGEEHKLLMALRESALEDEAAVQAFFERVIQTVVLEENYLILLARDAYDVPFHSKDGERQEDAAWDTFSYILCSVCPVKMTKPALSYHVHENEFASAAIDRLVSAPELGFMFPVFDDRSTNLYGALYYSRDITESHGEFVNAVFKKEAPMPAAEQKASFQSILESTLSEDCSLKVVRGVHGQLKEMIEEHKANKEEQPLTVSKGTLRRILQSEGASEEKLAGFDEQYDAAFGDEARLSPRNIVDTRQIELVTPDVRIQVNAGYGDLVETRVIDGVKYILVRAEDGVEMNGVPIRIM